MKIFCIGFHKTGTSSMGRAMEILGYSVMGARGTRDPDIARNAPALAEKYVPLFDAFQDNPWPILYRHLDRRYPGSKFILTVRDPNSWLHSILKHCGSRSTPMREWIYGHGNPRGHEREYLSRYVRHNEEVRQDFAGREGKDFLVMDLPGGDGWDRLCPFLGHEMVDREFPHRNRAGDRDKKVWIKRDVEALLGRFRGSAKPSKRGSHADH